MEHVRSVECGSSTGSGLPVTGYCTRLIRKSAAAFLIFPEKILPQRVTLFLPGGEVRSGAYAVFSLFALLPGKSWMLWLYLHIPGFALIAELAYRVVARHRCFCYWATRELWGIPIEVETFGIASWLFLRTLGVVYLLAFASFAMQAQGLIGSHGISPVTEFLQSLREYYGTVYWQVPTVFWLNAGDGTIKAVCIAGICLSVLLFLGVRWPILRVALFVLYLSLVTAGQEFMGYQWDALLLEAGFLAIVLGSSPIVVWLYRWLLFRLVFLSGAVKLASGDPSWRHFTALPVHYETQPLPTPLAWYMYQLPAWFQRGSVGFVFFVELIVPFLIFAPRRIRFLAARAIVVLQVLILLTGNYAFFNLLTISFCLFLIDDAFFQRVLPEDGEPTVLGDGLRKITCLVPGCLRGVRRSGVVCRRLSSGAHLWRALVPGRRGHSKRVTISDHQRLRTVCGHDHNPP